jgi:hypothetical protein
MYTQYYIFRHGYLFTMFIIFFLSYFIGFSFKTIYAYHIHRYDIIWRKIKICNTIIRLIIQSNRRTYDKYS